MDRLKKILQTYCGRYEQTNDDMTVKIYLAIQAALYTVPGFLHFFGLYLLHVIQHLGPVEDQRAYLINLSISECGFCFSKMIHRILYMLDFNSIALKVWIFQTGFFFTEVCFIMMLLTLDRFMAIYLNIKYRRYITKQRVKFCIAASWCLSLLVFLLCFLVVDIEYVVNLFTFLIWPIEEFSFLFMAIPVYIYIFIKVHDNKNRRKILKRHLRDLTSIQYKDSPTKTRTTNHILQTLVNSKSITTNTTSTNNVTQSSSADLPKPAPPTTTTTTTTEIAITTKSKPTTTAKAITTHTIMKCASDSRIRPTRKTATEKIKKNTFVPFLLILTFVLFWLVPDQIQLVLLLTTKDIPSEIYFASNLSYIVAAFCDGLIYIIGTPKVREFLSRSK